MLLNYHIGRFFLGLLCVGGSSCDSACSPDTTPAEPHLNSNTQKAKKKSTNVVIQQHSGKLLMMDILMPEIF